MEKVKLLLSVFVLALVGCSESDDQFDLKSSVSGDVIEETEFTDGQKAHIDSVAALIESYGFSTLCNLTGEERYRQLDSYLLMTMEEWKKDLEESNRMLENGLSRSRLAEVKWIDGYPCVGAQGWITDVCGAFVVVMMDRLYPSLIWRFNYGRVVCDSSLSWTMSSRKLPIQFNDRRLDAPLYITLTDGVTSMQLTGHMFINLNLEGLVESTGIF